MSLEWRSRLALAFLALALAPAAAWAEIPAEIEARIRAVTEDYRARGELRARMAPSPPDPVLARVLAENDRRIAATRMAAVVIAAITMYPALADELIANVSVSAPALADEVRDRVSLAFPFRAARPTPARKAAGAGRAPPDAGALSFGAAGSEEDEEEEAAAELAAADLAPQANDPLEGFNRAIFWVNDTLDRWIFRPIAWSYGKLMPEPGKQALRNVAQNLKGPIILANDLMQLEFADASVTSARLLANTTLGVIGLFDVAEKMGLERHPADFGQTLHVYGVGSGPYLMLPFFGPTTTRDGLGQVVDAFFDPLTYILEPTENVIAAGGKALIKRERVLEQTDELRRTSLDFYAAVRSLYLQNRAAELRPDKL